jgi:hypothetical protein
MMAHGVKNITTALVGTVIDNLAGNITQILFTVAPTSYEIPTFDPTTGYPTSGYFCLLDNSTTPPTKLFNYIPHSNGGYASPHASHKVSAYNIPFTSLYLQSCPIGATYSLTTA